MSLPGHEFLSKLEAAEGKIRVECEKITKIQENLPEEKSEEIASQINSAIGSGMLILRGKCKQFRELCQKNISEDSSGDGSPVDSVDGNFRTTKEDLEGFWDMISLAIEKVLESLATIERLKENDWRETKLHTKTPVNSKKKPLTTKNDKPDNETKKADEKRLEARKRFLAFKAAREQNKIGNSLPS